MPGAARPTTGARRLRLAAALLAGSLALFGCRPNDGNGQARPNQAKSEAAPARKLPLDAPLPTEIPKGTRLVIGDPTTQRVIQYLGWDKDLPFEIQWANIAGGPGVTEAFQAKALDVGSAANIPPIHAIWFGIPVKIIAWREKQDPLGNPSWGIGVSPKARDVKTLTDLKGRKIAFSPGQAQGAVVLKTLDDIGLKPEDVQLVDLPSTQGVYIGALAAGLVDAAPLGNTVETKRYLDDYGKDGARLLAHGRFREGGSNLYVRTEVLEDPAKAAALRYYIKLWGRAAEWSEQNRKEWTRVYYVENQGLSQADADYIVNRGGKSVVPAQWDGAIATQQEIIDLMARLISREKFGAAVLFDRRFEKIGAEGVESYRRERGQAEQAAAEPATAAPSAGTRPQTP
jgi:sulfonate transport system substrate-binding protein